MEKNVYDSVDSRSRIRGVSAPTGAEMTTEGGSIVLVALVGAISGAVILVTLFLALSKKHSLRAELAAKTAEIERFETEREHLHAILEECNARIDPEMYPDLHERIYSVLGPCDEAGRCVPLPTGAEAITPALRVLVEKLRQSDVRSAAGQYALGIDRGKWEAAELIEAVLSGAPKEA